MSEASPEDVQEQQTPLSGDERVEPGSEVPDDVPVADALEQAVVVEREDEESRD